MNSLKKWMMIKINFQEPNTDEWRAWRHECQKEQDKHNSLIQNGKTSEVKEAVYKGKRHNIKKNFYMSLDGPFHGKCVFCESLIVVSQPGHLDHYRPKSGLTDANNKKILKKDGTPHMGYYWLVYDYRNLVPACSDCNSPSSDNSGGVRVGKWGQFPVEEYRAEEPGEEVFEKPLLINPVYEDPKEHLKLQPNGVFVKCSDSVRGKTCIDIFGLNLREALVESRAEVYRNMKNEIALYIMAVYCNDTSEMQDRIDRIKKAWEGRKPYSAAARLAISERTHDLLKLVKRK